MPPKKSQHYVPRHYLAFFNDDDRTGYLPIYHLESGREFEERIAKLCTRNYFYEEGRKLEDAFTRIENAYLPVLRKIRKTESLDGLSQMDLRHLGGFILFQRARTRGMRIALEEIVQILGERIASGELERDIPDESVELLRTSPEKFSRRLHMRKLFEAFSWYPLLKGLEPLLVVNESPSEFIASDHPIVLDNPYFRNEPAYAIGRWESCGLQVFCPLGPDLLLLLYDPECYQLREEGNRITVSDSAVVERINNLQLIHCLDLVCYRTPGRREEFQRRQNTLSEYTGYPVYYIDEFDGDDLFSNDEKPLEMPCNHISEYSPRLPFFNHRIGVDLRPGRHLDTPFILDSTWSILDRLRD
ncbi:DUF4238 domain-containing protein [Haloterrigena alkaliphila]|uniref:DUF4238 domain-containing protein n=1 Tax=Haloterrigena alkaliphila TaxID=2816475 RepID=A0A8A2VI22_9EURY|nr:DUF4238 domain-containing protein [Haloterrigena alkaliphila]QSX00997.1 DUF4238 domain-containing protein [Haloterrigena alkaliphila]